MMDLETTQGKSFQCFEDDLLRSLSISLAFRLAMGSSRSRGPVMDDGTLALTQQTETPPACGCCEETTGEASPKTGGKF